jgi:hypothetical protein
VVLDEITELRALKHLFLHLAVRGFWPFDAETPVMKPILPTEHRFLELCPYRCVIIDIVPCLGFVFFQTSPHDCLCFHDLAEII